MRVRETVEIAAPPDEVFQVLQDIERWPTWNAAMQSVRIVGGGPPAVGAVVEVKQPKLPKAVWTISELTPGRSFSWTSTAPGLRSVGSHVVTPSGVGATAVLEFEQAGPLGAVLGALMSPLIRSYVRTEAAGLKARCEA